ncbi:hypothetical protein D9M68_786260 [compost metagenome]
MIVAHAHPCRSRYRLAQATVGQYRDDGTSTIGILHIIIKVITGITTIIQFGCSSFPVGIILIHPHDIFGINYICDEYQRRIAQSVINTHIGSPYLRHFKIRIDQGE